jgi:hypothetical protein
MELQTKPQYETVLKWTEFNNQTIKSKKKNPYVDQKGADAIRRSLQPFTARDVIDSTSPGIFPRQQPHSTTVT